MHSRPKQGAGGGGGDAVLTGAGLGDDPVLAHPLGEQRLTEGVVDLVRAGVGEVFPLEEDACSAGRLAQPLRLVERRRPADVVPGQLGDLVVEGGVVAGVLLGLDQLVEGRHQGFGRVLAAEPAEAAALVGHGERGRSPCAIDDVGNHDRLQ